MESSGFRNIPALDGVRALAVGLVFVFHATPDLLPGGYVGVNVFFVLSGFLITSLLAQELRLTGGLALAKFYGRRSVRLSPALILTLLVAVPVSFRVGAQGLLGDELTGLTYLSDVWILHDGPHVAALSQLWSLAVEEQFYLVWPLVLAAVLRRCSDVSWRALVAAAAALTAIKSVGYEIVGWAGVYFTPLGSADQLVLGAALALAIPAGKLDILRRPSAGIVGGLVVLVGAFGLHEVQDPKAYRGGMFVIALGAASLIGHLVIASSSSSLTCLFSARWIRWVGQRSYGIYLFHLAALALVADLHARRGLQLLLALAWTVIMAALSFRWVERPISQCLRPKLKPVSTAAHST